MNTREFIEFCDATEHGRKRFVRFVGRHEGLPVREQIGRVLSCERQRFEVETETGRHAWPMDSCEPVLEGGLLEGNDPSL